MDRQVNITPQDLDAEHAITYPVEAFLSKEYLEIEKKALWPKTWQMAERVEDIPNVGDWFTYDVADESVIVIRVKEGDGPGTLRAFHNVCPHRGRQLVDVHPGTHDSRGSNRTKFICGFHGWTFNTEGENVYILDPDDWHGALHPGCTGLTPVQVDTWGGWIFVNMDPEAEPLIEFLGEVDRILGPYQFEKMRYKWRNWVVFDCNWKTGLEAFMEPYHVAGTHTQLLAYGEYYAYSKQYGLHGVSGFDERDSDKREIGGSSSTMRAGKGEDARISTYELTRENWETVNNASTTWTLVEAARLLQEELPEGTPTGEVIAHWFKRAKEIDAARGVDWPELTPAQMTEAGLAWHIFPNMSVLHGSTYALCYRTRPYGDDPDKCIFEAYAIERFPEGEAPQTEWTHGEATLENWGSVLCQDFSNMAAVQRGMKSSGFKGTMPNPHQEQKVTNFHRNLANVIGRGHVKLLDR
ncbi:MAG: aromatic ring-hydroxylating dioxygenase subunit alpha [Sphingomonadales bacterium]|nr:aromatic ring-hydroxylating dioxygenase subunit alpha [Sphingomonadales bacterium]